MPWLDAVWRPPSLYGEEAAGVKGEEAVVAVVSPVLVMLGKS